MKIATSYFYQIRYFSPNMIPVSTCMSDPKWYRPIDNKEYYIDKRGIVCGLRYEPLIVQSQGTHGCPGPGQCWYAVSDCRDPQGNKVPCPTMIEYEQLLNTLVDKEKTLKAFEYCANKFQKELKFKEEPIIVLIVYESPVNPCSERFALQRYFNCKELELEE